MRSDWLAVCGNRLPASRLLHNLPAVISPAKEKGRGAVGHAPIGVETLELFAPGYVVFYCCDCRPGLDCVNTALNLFARSMGIVRLADNPAVLD